MSEIGEITELLEKLPGLQTTTDREVVLNELFPLVRKYLYSQANHLLAGQSPGFTLQATQLVDMAFVKLASAKAAYKDKNWSGRREFFAIAAKVMLNDVIDHARKRTQRAEVNDAAKALVACPDKRPEDPWEAIYLADTFALLEAALAELDRTNPDAAEAFRARVFVDSDLCITNGEPIIGERVRDQLRTVRELAEILGIPRATAADRLKRAQDFLSARIMS